MVNTDVLFNYGILGLWTVYLLWEKKNILNKMERMSVALDRNTDVLDLLLLKTTNKRMKK